MKNNNKNGYSIIIALLVTWFLLLLVVWVFNLVLKELKDTRAMWNYYKAYYWAEAAQELALLKIKEKWYWIDSNINFNINDWTDSNIDFSINDNSVILSDNPTDKSLFNPRKDVYIWYSLNTKTNLYTWELNWLKYDILPLFFIDEDENEHKINDLNLDILSANWNDLIWNIVSWNWNWISWTWELDWNTFSRNKEVIASSFSISDIVIKDFLNDNDTNYLILFNSWDQNLKYSINSINDSEYFSKPKTYIISSAKVWDYKQNLRTFLDNTAYLNILKYSIYSN